MHTMKPHKKYIFVCWFLFILLFSLLSSQNLMARRPNNATDTLNAYLRKELQNINELRGVSLNEKIRQLVALIPLIEQDDDTSLIVKSYDFLAGLYIDKGIIDTAHIYLQKTIPLQISVHDFRVSYDLFTNFGKYYYYVQEQDSALEAFSKCLRLATEVEDIRLQGMSHNNLGIIYEWRSEYQKSYNHYIESLRIFEEIDVPDQLVQTLNNLGVIMQNLNEFEKSINFLEQAIQLNLNLNNPVNLAMNYGNLGNSQKDLKQYEEALKSQQNALFYAQQEGLVLEVARAQNNIGHIYFLMDSIEKAESYLKESLLINKNQHFRFGSMKNYSLLANVYREFHKYEEALMYVDSALLLAKEFNVPDDIVSAYKIKSELTEVLGKPKESLHYLKLFNKLEDSINEIANKQHILDLQTKYETEAKDIENAALLKENEAKARTIRLQRIMNFTVIGILLIFVVLIIVIAWSRRKTKMYNEALELLNKEIKEQNIDLEELNSTKDILFSIISHDLRSPFNSLLGFLNIMLDDYETLSETEKKDILLGLYGQSNKTYNLLDNLLRWAMSQRGQIIFNPTLVDLAEIIETELNTLRSRIEKKYINLENFIQSPTHLEADRDMLLSVFRNLLNNAINYTDEGGEIKLTAEEVENEITVSISDNGWGMSETMVEAIMAGRGTLVTKTSEASNGTGLGLVIVKGFIEKHNGKLLLESELGKGSKFIIVLPKTAKN